MCAFGSFSSFQIRFLLCSQLYLGSEWLIKFSQLNLRLGSEWLIKLSQLNLRLWIDTKAFSLYLEYNISVKVIFCYTDFIYHSDSCRYISIFLYEFLTLVATHKHISSRHIWRHLPSSLRFYKKLLKSPLGFWHDSFNLTLLEGPNIHIWNTPLFYIS
jgi:hypothetical protein